MSTADNLDLGRSTPLALGYGHDPALLLRVLEPYKPHCRYLQSTSVSAEPSQANGHSIKCTGAFAIPEPCYIDDTGHFNAVEFNICFNQIMYYTLAKSVKERLRSPFSEWTMDDYWDRQLPNILILDLHSSFERGLRSQGFQGEVELKGVRQTRGRSGPLLLIDMTCRFWDDQGGRCHGEVKLAVTDPPG